MKTIGQTLACVLLAAVLAKNVLAQSAGNIEFSKGRTNETSQARHHDISRLRQLISQLDPDDVGDSPSIPDDKRKDEKSGMSNFTYVLTHADRENRCTGRVTSLTAMWDLMVRLQWQPRRWDSSPRPTHAKSHDVCDVRRSSRSALMSFCRQIEDSWNPARSA